MHIMYCFIYIDLNMTLDAPMLLEFKKHRPRVSKKLTEENPSLILGPSPDEWYEFFVKVNLNFNFELPKLRVIIMNILNFCSWP
jgi:hypothetical protein